MVAPGMTPPLSSTTTPETDISRWSDDSARAAASVSAQIAKAIEHRASKPLNLRLDIYRLDSGPMPPPMSACRAGRLPPGRLHVVKLQRCRDRPACRTIDEAD